MSRATAMNDALLAAWLRMRLVTNNPQISPWVPWNGSDIRWRYV